MVIRFIKVTHAYGHHIVLDDLSYNFQSKQYLIKGASGIGKTTLLNLASGYLKPTKGNIETTKIKIGYIFQTNTLLANFTIKENIEIAKSISKNTDTYDQIVKVTNIEPILNEFPNHISGGERQRASIAVTLAAGCDFILADEPTGSLDPENAQNIRELFRILNQELNIGYIVCSHDYSWERTVDITLELTNGKLHPCV